MADYEEARIEVREFDHERDSRGVEEVETRCEVGPTGEMSLFTDLLGDPICRIRHSPAFLMLVAELVVMPGENKEGGGEGRREIVGMVRGCIKTVTCGPQVTHGNMKGRHDPVYTKLAYILGLRVSPSHRRMGIAVKLVDEMEGWLTKSGAEYAYIATESDNLPSINLFTKKCGYSKFRTPSILVHPVFAHRVHISHSVSIIKLAPSDAEALYRHRFSTTEFFPRDIHAVLRNKLTLGTFLALPRHHCESSSSSSWAVVSVWNCNDVWRLQVKGAPRWKRAIAKTTRFIDKALPWLRIPSVPEVFMPFGLHFMYGLGGEGPMANKLVKALCGFAHNLARGRGCGVVATQVAPQDPLRLAVPHWKTLSCAEDLWCMKRIREGYSDGFMGDWTKSPPAPSIFVDPREF